MKTLVLTLTFLILATSSLAQKGTAEPDFYPPGFVGDTWTGIVTDANEDTREFTLTYQKKDKTETFVGVLPKIYTVRLKDGRDHEIKMDELRGMRLKAYYITRQKKDANGVKVKTHEVFKIKYLPKEK